MSTSFHTWAEPDLYLLADEDVVETCEKAVRRLCPIEKQENPIIVPDKPWEGCRSENEPNSLQDPFYSVVLFDPVERMFRCWYNAYDRFVNRVNVPPLANQGSSCCYAASSDGVTWEKPFVRQVLYQGSLANNIVRFMDRAAKANPSVLAEQAWSIFPCSAPESEDRFAASLYTQYDDPVYSKGITVCFSPDGLRWRMHFPPVLPLDGDCHSMCWDPRSNCFLATTRSYQHANLCRRWGRSWKRHIALARSRDLFHWTPMQTVLEADEGDPEDAQLYMMHIVPYGHAYLGQLLVFYTDEMVLEHQLALSRDLEHWQRVGDRKPILERGAEGSWDSKHVSLSNNSPHPEGNLMRFWYGGKSTPHYQAGYAALGTGTLRRDGFVCYEAGDPEAVLTTLPLKVKGWTTLALNVDATDGEVLVEVVDKEGTPLEGCTRKDCTPIRGDHIRVVVNFHAGPGRYFDRGNLFRFPHEFRFRFYLRRAKLFAFKAPHLEPVWPAFHN
jgi:hypothetical protein